MAREAKYKSQNLSRRNDMSAASMRDIENWFDRGVEDKATHLIVACDTFDHDDFPVYVLGGDDFWSVYGRYANKPDQMLRVMEVYDLSADKQNQLMEFRAWHLPPRRS
jgi:hypothetical protein